jgi:hypothetical protein
MNGQKGQENERGRMKPESVNVMGRVKRRRVFRGALSLSVFEV